MDSYTALRAAVADIPSHSLRGRANTIKPELLQEITMSSKTDPAASSGSSSSPPTEAKDADKTEQFPDFSLQRKASQHKAKSHSASDILTQAIPEEDLSSAIDRIKGETPPLSLDEVRQRKASIKDSAREQRKASIALIRSRTASRASTSGARPNLEDIKGSD